MTSTVNWDEPDGPYGPLVETMLANQAGVEAGSDDVEAVAGAIAGILDSDDPPFNTLVGASALRTSDASVAEYERQIFAFYGLRRFRAPYAEDHA